MKKKGFYEYDPVIYPRRLYVVIGYDTQYLRGVFSYDGGRDLEDIDDNSNGITYFEVMRKDNKKIGELVAFPSKKEMTMNVISHESSHVCDGIEEALGISHGGEHSAYLMGWIASCVNKARLGLGTYVELNLKAMDNHKEYNHRYYKRNKESRKSHKRAYYEANRDRILAHNRAYYQAHIDYLRLRGRVYRQALKLYPGRSEKEQRIEYTKRLLSLILNKNKSEYGETVTEHQ